MLPLGRVGRCRVWRGGGFVRTVPARTAVLGKASSPFTVKSLGSSAHGPTAYHTKLPRGHQMHWAEALIVSVALSNSGPLPLPIVGPPSPPATRALVRYEFRKAREPGGTVEDTATCTHQLCTGIGHIPRENDPKHSRMQLQMKTGMIGQPRSRRTTHTMTACREKRKGATTGRFSAYGDRLRSSESPSITGKELSTLSCIHCRTI